MGILNHRWTFGMTTGPTVAYHDNREKMKWT